MNLDDVHHHLTQRCILVAMIVLLLFTGSAQAQQGAITLDMGIIDGVTLTPDNIATFTVQSSLPAATDADITGTVRYRQSGKWLRYTCRTRLQPGLNRIESGNLRLLYESSDASMKELFLSYKVLPQGTFQYCVAIEPVSARGERIAGSGDEQCLISKSEDLFLINLVDPENNAKLYERNPVFSWVVNYPFASQLTYRIRIAEVKPGQNNVAAISRNNPVYAESNLPQTTTTYPVYGKPLELFQPYAWTVDAYFKGLLLGGAEPWRFTIVEDSELVSVPTEQAYYEFEKHEGDVRIYAPGTLKLKYFSERQNDTLTVALFNDKGLEIAWPEKRLALALGDNRLVLPLMELVDLQHKKNYVARITTEIGKRYEVRFRYINPLFIK